MLAVLDPETLRTALASGDIAMLTRVPGIGRKGAERLVVELRDKVGVLAPVSGASVPAGCGVGAVRTQVTEALTGLGFATRQAEQAVEAVLAEADSESMHTPDLLRSALARLGRNR
jgi:Holliday junction DNA helicase RuvA